MTDDNEVKLTDVGVAKHEKEISGTLCGTLLYLAPEVLSGQMYDSKADMYSFGVILWEMWYAQTAFQSEFACRSQFQLLDGIREGLRPNYIQGMHQPWKMWKLVMETCWSKEPHLRLSAKESWEVFEKLQEKVRGEFSTEHNLLAEVPQMSPGHGKPAVFNPLPLKLKAATKPQPVQKQQPAPKPNTAKHASVSFSTKTDEANVCLQ